MRVKRVFLDNGFMHLITRGNGKQILFEDDQDRNYYLKLLRRYSAETGVVVCAYCLMENHVHLLVHYQQKNVSKFMQKIGISFTRYYNMKYDHCGHLFQGRYKSENVNDETYFLVVNRYILQNPLKAGISTVEAYPWSSFDIYARRNAFVDSSLFLDLLGGYDAYLKYVCSPMDEICMEYEIEKTSDTSAYRRISEMLDVKSGSELMKFDKIQRDNALKRLKDEGMTIRQISRLTGIGRNIVQKA